ncbi:hypothetical protein C8R43DRAFT_1125328 [Mycena crocata]|nr:hypothetical protein C8R43DRAFT_1125328 [Mycena crocata]
MTPHRWTTDEPFEFLASQIAKYFHEQTQGTQISFFKKLDEAWLRRWPEEANLGLPAHESGVPLGEADALRLATAIEKRKNVSAAGGRQLRVWFRNNAKPPATREVGAVPKATQADSLAGGIWRDTSRHRDPQLVEIYQKQYPDRVDAALAEAGFDTLRRTHLEWMPQDGEPDKKTKTILRQEAGERLRMRRAASRKAFDDETDEIKDKVRAELARIRAEKLEPKAEQPLTPASVQL